MGVELELDSKELMIWVAEHPYADALGKKNLTSDVYIGIEDPEAERGGFADKYEVEYIQKYLWKNGFVLKPVSCHLYMYHM